jgi:pantetheine-phosphate adenylyltransferase
MTATEYSYLSSSMVKDIARLGGDITGLVPSAVLKIVSDKYAPGVATAGAQLIEGP